MKIEDPFGRLYVIIHAAAAASGCFDMNYLKMGREGSSHTAGKLYAAVHLMKDIPWLAAMPIDYRNTHRRPHPR